MPVKEAADRSTSNAAAGDCCPRVKELAREASRRVKDEGRSPSVNEGARSPRLAKRAAACGLSPTEKLWGRSATDPRVKDPVWLRSVRVNE
jgi:hypothetical protein